MTEQERELERDQWVKDMVEGKGAELTRAETLDSEHCERFSEHIVNDFLQEHLSKIFDISETMLSSESKDAFFEKLREAERELEEEMKYRLVTGNFRLPHEVVDSDSEEEKERKLNEWERANPSICMDEHGAEENGKPDLSKGEPKGLLNSEPEIKVGWDNEE